MNQVMRALQMNDERVLASKTIWLCSSCYTCTTRCPRGIDVTGVMDALRIEAKKRKIPPAIPEIPTFNALALPPFSLWMNVTRGSAPNSRVTTVAVSSVAPSSTTMTWMSS